MTSFNNKSQWTKRGVFGFLISAVLLMSYSSLPYSSLNAVKTVVIDPGHGGKDAGNLGTKTKKRVEKDISLDVALKVGKYIEDNYPDVNVIYTRKTDKFLELRERVSIANKAQADLFISIHCNAASPKAYGTETFVMGMHKSEASLNTAIRENQSIYLEDNYEDNYKGFNPKDPDTYIKLSMRQNVFLNQSLSLSKKIQDQFRERVNRRDRGVKQAGYYVISYTTMPSVLVELGFLTNKEEENFLHSKNGQEYMSSAIYRAFKQYKNEIEGITLDEDSSSDPKKEEKENQGDSENGDTLKPSEKQDSKNVDTVLETSQKEESDTKEITKTSENKGNEGLIYRIQIVTSSQKVAIKASNFKGLTDVDEYISNGLYKYSTGNVSSYEEAKNLQKEIREKGYPGAFIIAFKDNKRIDLRKAISLE